MNILIAILVLSLLIIVHELGHFYVARWAGIQVDEFSVGMGPKLCGWKPAGQPTAYSLRLFPLGGYTKMAGAETGDEDNPNGFNRKPLRSRIAVIMAGSVTNFLTAVLLFILVFGLIGVPGASNANVIGEVVMASPAARAGLQPGDRIVKVGDVQTGNWTKLADTIHERGQRSTNLTVVRHNRRLQISVTPAYSSQLKMTQIGIQPSVIWMKKGIITAVALGLQQTATFTQVILQGIGQMISGSVAAKEIAGPVGITQMIGGAAQSGIGYLLTLTGILGINLALVNMLPIPALDGGRLVFLIIEGLRGKPVNPEKENMVHLIGFALLMLLFVFTFYNDLMRIFTGG